MRKREPRREKRGMMGKCVLLLILPVLSLVFLQSFHLQAQGQAIAPLVRIDPPQINNLGVGDNFTIHVWVDNAVSVTGAQVQFTYDPTVLNATQVVEGPFLPSFGPTIIAQAVAQSGEVHYTSAIASGAAASGSGILLNVTFTIISEGSVQFHLIPFSSTGTYPGTYFLDLMFTTIIPELHDASFSSTEGGTIYIRADGSIDPPTAPVHTADSITYTLTGNITADADGIVIERDNIVMSGAGFTVTGNGSGNGVYLASCGNVTVRNMQVTAFGTGIYLWDCANCTIWGNNLTSNSSGIFVGGGDSSYNDISSNNITGNQVGIGFEGTGHGEYNKIYHNNFIQNSNQAAEPLGWDIWDNGYPSGGNYWSDYNGTDLYSGQFQNESGSDGIGDSPYNIIWEFEHMGVYYYVMGQDHYPFTTPFGSNSPLAYPAARFTYAPLPPVVGQPVVFNASTTTCTNGTIIRYDWNFGDGENGTGQTVSHTYTTFGNYNVTLTAMSNTRIPDTENQAIYVRRPPLPLWETWTLVAAGITTIVVASIAISLAAKRIKHKKHIKARSHLDTYLAANVHVRAGFGALCVG